MTGKKLAALDAHILNALQGDFPISVAPFADLAVNLGISEDELLERIQALKDQGLIRRIGGVLDARTLGFYSTLCACQIPNADIDRVAALINQERGVTHNYVRDHVLNIWFTLTACSREEADKIISRLEKEAGTIIYSLPATRVFKIRVRFPLQVEGEKEYE